MTPSTKTVLDVKTLAIALGLIGCVGGAVATGFVTFQTKSEAKAADDRCIERNEFTNRSLERIEKKIDELSREIRRNN